MRIKKNTLYIPFWDQAFDRLRTNSNVTAGHFRIGALLLETRINCFLFIAATVIEDQSTQPIGNYANQLLGELKTACDLYESGLTCAAEFINEALLRAHTAHVNAEHSNCPMRIKSCDAWECPAVSTPSRECECKRENNFLDEYDSRK